MYYCMYMCVYIEHVTKHTILVPLYIKSIKTIHCKIILLTFSFNIFSSCGLNDIATNEQGKEQNTGQVKKEKESRSLNNTKLSQLNHEYSKGHQFLAKMVSSAFVLEGIVFPPKNENFSNKDLSYIYINYQILLL